MSDTNTADTSAQETVTPEALDQAEAALEPQADQTAQPQTTEQKQEVAEIKKALKAFEIKVNGKSKTVEVDPSNDEELKKYIQKAMASDEKFQEAATYRKQAEQLVELLQSNPMAILKNPALGLDIKKLAQDILLKELEEEEKTPEQKELETAREKLRKYEEEKKTAEERHKQEMLQKLVQEQQQVTENSIIEALNKSDLPESPYVVRRIADIMVSAVENGWEDVQIQDIMPYAEEVIMEELKKVFTKHNTPEKLERIVGKETLNGYRKSRIEKLKSAPKTANQLTEDSAKTDKDGKKPEPKRLKIGDSIW